jgi:hypothetical protein
MSYALNREKFLLIYLLIKPSHMNKTVSKVMQLCCIGLLILVNFILMERRHYKPTIWVIISISFLLVGIIVLIIKKRSL